MKEGWKKKKFCEILEKTETINPLQYPNTKFDYIDVSSVSNLYFKIENTQKIKGKDAPSRARRLVKENDVIFATVRPTLKRIAIIPKELDNQICSTGYFILRPNPEINHRYLFYSLFTKDFLSNMEKLQKGASYPAVTDNDMRNQELSFPTLPEQQRIVDILDQTFAAIDQAIENMEKNIALSNSIFENHLNNYFTFRQLNWIEKKLNKLGLVQTGSTPSTLNKYYFGEFIPFIKPGDVDVDGFGNLNYENEKLSEQGLKVSRRILNNSILMVCIGGSIGKVGITNRDITCNQQINSLTLREDYFPKFFYYAMRSYSFNKQVLNGASQATLPIINKSKWENLSISFPDNISEQKKISSELDDLLNQSQNLQNLYIQKINKLQELKQSLLHKAFQGEL